jgi:outer membrane lipoprotein SlyB
MLTRSFDAVPFTTSPLRTAGLQASRDAGHSASLRAVLLAVALVMGLAGCASGLGANDYERGQVGSVSRVEEGVVLAARAIMIEGREGVLGAAAGATIGGIAGSEMGGGDKAQTAGAVVGAVAGGVLGRQIERGATRKPGFAYTVRLKSGQLVTVTQGGDVAIAVGAPVFVEYGARARVIPQTTSPPPG